MVLIYRFGQPLDPYFGVNRGIKCQNQWKIVNPQKSIYIFLLYSIHIERKERSKLGSNQLKYAMNLREMDRVNELMKSIELEAWN